MHCTVRVCADTQSPTLAVSPVVFPPNLSVTLLAAHAMCGIRADMPRPCICSGLHLQAAAEMAGDNGQSQMAKSVSLVGGVSIIAGTMIVRDVVVRPVAVAVVAVVAVGQRLG